MWPDSKEQGMFCRKVAKEKKSGVKSSRVAYNYTKKAVGMSSVFPSQILKSTGLLSAFHPFQMLGVL
jgi:hypothetical protein